MKRLWYWPSWKMTEPLKVGAWKGGDEYGRDTSCLSLGPLGTFIWAHEDEKWKGWIEHLVERDLMLSAVAQAALRDDGGERD